MSIQGDLEELGSLRKQIDITRKEIAQLRAQENACRTRIITYLQESGQPGVKLDDRVYHIETKVRRTRRNKTDRVRTTTEFLQHIGVTQPDQYAQKLLDFIRGEPHVEETLKVKRAGGK